MFGTTLLLLAVPFGSFAVMRMYQRTGHKGVLVWITGATFLVSVLCSMVTLGTFMWSFSFQEVATLQAALISLTLLLGCVLLATGMALLLSLKEWPIKNLD